MRRSGQPGLRLRGQEFIQGSDQLLRLLARPVQGGAAGHEPQRVLAPGSRQAGQEPRSLPLKLRHQVAGFSEEPHARVLLIQAAKGHRAGQLEARPAMAIRRGSVGGAGRLRPGARDGLGTVVCFGFNAGGRRGGTPSLEGSIHRRGHCCRAVRIGQAEAPGSLIGMTPSGPISILVTGGAGYIGSHACLRLLELGHRVVAVDNLVRGHAAAAEALGRLGGGRFTFSQTDLADTASLARLLGTHQVSLVMHFAALAYVGESVHEPLRYYRNNVAGSLSLLAAMRDAGVHRLVFSSTCATYGVPPPERIPIDETCPQAPINPYGASKLMTERAVLDILASAEGRSWSAAFLRYFNVAGSDPEGRLGEDHRPETHLIPICLQVALGARSHVEVMGTDYPTPDGTCIRDYVHVTDLVEAHVLAMTRLEPGRAFVANLGIGEGFSVRQVLDACRRVTGHPIPAKEAPRREGDPPRLCADASKARRELGWAPRFESLERTVATAWEWMRRHPRGWGS